jgi:hypothetical protein
MLTHHVDYDTRQPPTITETPVEIPNSLTAETNAAIADLDDDSRVEKMLRVAPPYAQPEKLYLMAPSPTGTETK